LPLVTSWAVCAAHHRARAASGETELGPEWHKVPRRWPTPEQLALLAALRADLERGAEPEAPRDSAPTLALGPRRAVREHGHHP
jgi:hypothetical protein